MSAWHEWCDHEGMLSVPRTVSVPRAPRLLVGEDDEAMRSLLSASLRADGFEVIEMKDGEEVLVHLSDVSAERAPTPDLVIMDVRMPRHSGLELLAAMHLAEWKVPVILITAFGDDRLHRRAKELGAAAVFDKPFDLDDLRTAILNLCPAAHAMLSARARSS
jgi:two-component system, response regulator, stage 0 sporulation protein F